MSNIVWNAMESPNMTDLVLVYDMLLALLDPTRPDHYQVTQSLSHAVNNASFVYTMLYIFVAGHQVAFDRPITLHIRQVAGFIIKNVVFPVFNSIPQQVQVLIKQGMISLKVFVLF